MTGRRYFLKMLLSSAMVKNLPLAAGIAVPVSSTLEVVVKDYLGAGPKMFLTGVRLDCDTADGLRTIGMDLSVPIAVYPHTVTGWSYDDGVARLMVDGRTVLQTSLGSGPLKLRPPITRYGLTWVES